MIRLQRPTKPVNFPTPAIEEAEEEAKRAGGKPANWPDHWSRYKANFTRAQGHKCGWCEAPHTSEPGAVDHIAPKAEVGWLETQGEEVDDLTNVPGRKASALHDIGYWWLAYDWDNWVFACNRSNSGWKKTLYPVAENPHPRPDESVKYTPLLLNPFGPDDPLDHLDMDPTGQITRRGNSPKGKATIETLGLDRESLRRVRHRRVADAESMCRQIRYLLDQDAALEEAIERLLAWGADGHEFAAVTRCVIRRVLKLEWSDFAEV